MTEKLIFLTPGPSELYFTVEDHLKIAFREHLLSMSHRSKKFQEVVTHTTQELRKLMNIPDNFYIVFTASATEVWERIMENLVEETSFHFVNGTFSKRFYDTAIALNRKSTQITAELGQGFDLEKVTIPDEAEVIGLALNETSTGVVMPLEQIAELRATHPEKLIAVDAVSSVPFPMIDFSQIDTLFFSVQKCFGLPAGLGVWVFNERCVEKAQKLIQKQSIGFHHSIPSFIKQADKNQTPCTPNMLNIFLLGKVAEDMNRYGIENIRRDINYKSALLYHALENSSKFEIFVKNSKFQSKTVVVADVLSGNNSEFLGVCREKGLVVGTGYGSTKKSQIRIANFPAHSKETIEKLVDIIQNY